MNIKNSVLCTICARGGSKGVKNKNIREINGKPLIAYTIEQAKQSMLFDHIVLSTDSEEIMSVATSFGAEVFFKRPQELSSDTAAKIPVIQHAFVESEKFFSTKYDYLVDLDATSPLRESQDIINAFDLLIKSNYSNVITAMPARRSPYFNMVEVLDGKVCKAKIPTVPINRRQDAPACYDMNASIYVWDRDTILNEVTLFLPRTGLYIMPEDRSIDIDSEFDFEIVEFLLRKKCQM